MDKMSTWQLLGTFDVDVTTQKWKGSVKDERDWMQIFCEDLVETQSVFSILVNSIASDTCF